jgi:transposase
MFGVDEQLLRELARKCSDPRGKVRYLALHALSKGYGVSSVSEIFCVDVCTIYRWINKWKKEKDIQDKPRSGRPPVLDKEDKEEIKRLLEENNPRKYGINASFWDTKEFQMYFAKQGRPISRETLRVYLKKMGARYVKAVLKYPEADMEQQREFAKNFFEETDSSSAVVLFHDEMSAGCSPRKGYGWTLNKRLEVKAPQRHRKRVNCFGAVSPMKGEIIQMTSKEAKAPVSVRFLHKILKKYPGKDIILYLDNLSVHKSKKVKKFIEKHPNMRLEYLPPYSPELNPQEQWWNYERKKFLNNRNFSSTHQLATSMSWFAKRVQPEQIMSICSLAPLEKLM